MEGGGGSLGVVALLVERRPPKPNPLIGWYALWLPDSAISSHGETMVPVTLSNHIIWKDTVRPADYFIAPVNIYPSL